MIGEITLSEYEKFERNDLPGFSTVWLIFYYLSWAYLLFHSPTSAGRKIATGWR